MVVGAFELKNKSLIFKPDARVQFPNCEKKLFEKFKELRKVGIPVDGKYLKAKMLEIVGEDSDAAKEPIKVKKFKATDTWRASFCNRYGITLRFATNKKTRSAFKSSRMVRNFHWYVIYKAALTYSGRKS